MPVNGVWTYGTSATADAGPDFNAVLDGNHKDTSLPGLPCATTGFEGWGEGVSDLVPLIAVNTSGASVSGVCTDDDFEPSKFWVHPDPLGGANTYVVVRWTAPAAGTVDITSEWIQKHASCSDGITTHVRKNGASVLLNDNNHAYAESNIDVLSGDTIDFVTGPGTEYFCDSTQFNAVITFNSTDHLLLYQVKVAEREDDKYGDHRHRHRHYRDHDDVERMVSLSDQFDDVDQSRQFEVEDVKRLGNPVDKNGEGISDASIRPNLVVNGSFEDGACVGSFETNGPISPWTIDSGSIDKICTLWEADEGDRSIDMSGNGAGKISQDIPTVVGAIYVVDFAMAGNPGGPPTIKTLRVSAAADTSDFTFDTTDKAFPSPMGWEDRQFVFTATSTTTTLAFESLDATAFGPVLDSVSVHRSDADGHLVAYEIDRVRGEARHQKLTGVLVSNQFGDITLDTKKAEILLLPSLKDLLRPIADDAVPDPFSLDHFKCYSVKVTKHTDAFVKRQVSVVDQFNQPTVLDVNKPKWLCNPVSKDGGKIRNSEDHLLCYDVKRAEGEAKFERVSDIHTNNQFGPLQFDAKKEKELCVPSKKDLTNAVPKLDDDDRDHHDRDRHDNDHDKD